MAVSTGDGRLASGRATARCRTAREAIDVTVDPGFGPEQDRSEGEHREVVRRPLVAARRDPPVLLEAVHEALDPVAAAIRLAVERCVPPIVRRLIATPRDDRADMVA